MPATQGTGCVVCKDLKRVQETATSEYHLARAAPFYRVSTEIAAKLQVDMERAKISLSEHLSSCPNPLHLPQSSGHNSAVYELTGATGNNRRNRS